MEAGRERVRRRAVEVARSTARRGEEGEAGRSVSKEVRRWRWRGEEGGGAAQRGAVEVGAGATGGGEEAKRGRREGVKRQPGAKRGVSHQVGIASMNRPTKGR